MNVGEAVVTITGDTKKLDQSLKDSQNKVKSSADKMKKALLPVGLALTAVGAAGLKMVDSAKKMNAQLGVTALNLGISTKEMRNLALETTNVTFPLKEVTATFDLLARAGITDAEVLRDTATAFDTLGDATGNSASMVANAMIPAMKTFGLTAEEIAQKTDAMTFMTRNTTLSLADFNTMVGYTTPALVKQGLTMDDLTVALIHMEKQGYAPGRVMTREFMKATTLAAKEQIPLTEALGMTTEQTEAYKRELEDATGITDEYAEVANKQYGIMDKVRQRFDELVLSAGSLLEPMEPLLAGMTALGPLMIALSTSAGQAAVKWGLHTLAVVASALAHPIHTAALIASKIAMIASAVAIKTVTIAQWAWNAAMTANPIGLIIAGIVALVAAGILLWKNWDKVTAFFKKAWINIKIFFLTGVEKIMGALTKFTSWIPWLGDRVKEAHDAIANMIEAEKVKQAALETKEALEDVGEAAEEMGEEVAEGAEVAEEGLEELALTAERTTDDMLSDFRDLTDRVRDEARKRLNFGLSTLRCFRAWEVRDEVEVPDGAVDVTRDEKGQWLWVVDAAKAAH